jgi:hypothetical protein
MSLAGSLVVCRQNELTYRGVDPHVGARRAQSTSKDLAYRGRILMLHGGPTFVTFLGQNFD